MRDGTEGSGVGPASSTFHVEEADTIFFLDGYGKDEKGDLSPQEKKILKGLAEGLKAERVRVSKRSR